MPGPQYQHVKTRVEDGILVLTITLTNLEGDRVVTDLRKDMLAAADFHQAHEVVIDFRQTQFISSAAFWPLLSLHKHVKEAGGRMVLCGLSPLVGDLFYTTKLASPDGSFAAPFALETDVAAAIAHLKSEPKK
jgi:anti-anti-sigma factor